MTRILRKISGLTLEFTRLRVGKARLTYQNLCQQEMVKNRGGSNSRATNC